MFLCPFCLNRNNNNNNNNNKNIIMYHKNKKIKTKYQTYCFIIQVHEFTVYRAYDKYILTYL